MDSAVDQFQGGVSIFQQQLDALIASVNAERATLAESNEQLKRERQAYEEEKQRVSQVCKAQAVCQGHGMPFTAAVTVPDFNTGFLRQRAVVLNVGGVNFTTTQITLQNAPAPSLFAAMFSGRHTLRADQASD